MLSLTFWAKADATRRLDAFTQVGTAPYTDDFRQSVTVGPEWRAYAASGIAKQDYKPGEMQAGLHFGYEAGTYEFAAMNLTSQTITPDPNKDVAISVPITANGAPNPAWRWVNVTTDVSAPETVRARFQVKAGANPWEHSIGTANSQPILPGETVYFVGDMRSQVRSRATVFYELASEPHTKYLSAAVRLTPEWKTFKFAAAVPRALAPGQGQLTIFLGYESGEVEFRNLRVTNRGMQAPNSLPETRDYYGGVPIDDSWKKAAEERIARLRQADITVMVVDRAGKPVPGAQVRARMNRHAFRFGTAAPAQLINENEKFRETLKRLFNTVTFENDLKWFQFTGADYRPVDSAINWLNANGFQVRGHTLVWGSERNIPREAWALSNDELRRAIEARVVTTAERFRGKVYLWDVVNEARTELALWERIGWEWFPRTYALAHRADPGAKLCYNDFAITEDAETGPGPRTVVKERIQRLIDAKAPFDVIGIQGHVGVPITPMPKVLEILDDYAKFGKELEITEYDLGVWDDAVHGKHMEDFLTASFSHPAVTAFIMWGFWEGAHWRANEGGHLFRRDWSERPAVAAYENLVKKKWWTDATVRADARGRARIRGFKGDYTVTVTANGRTVSRPVPSRSGAGASVRIVL